ncbi:MAG TPA: AAA family ATPase [Nocardioidaceae bacterium]|nr:AAA family ATPase [Nocardioidaceae bacterium]
MHVRIDMLGGFSVTVDGVAVADYAWSRRHAAGLVKLLALSRGRRMHREQVIDALWPDTSIDAAGPRLHKAAHYARRALGDQAGTLVLRNDVVTLLPGADVVVDALEFRSEVEAALAEESCERAERALDMYGGSLLPEDLYEPWVEEHRESLAALRCQALRLTGRWEDLLREDPADEQAHLALVRAASDRGDTRTALRQLERMDQALRRELGTTPSPAAEALRRSLLEKVDRPAAKPAEATSPPPAGNRLVGRRDVGDLFRAHLAEADAGRGSTLLVTGPPGVGKSAVLDLAVALAHQRGWRTGRGTASAVEGQWPYAPVLEALGDLCRKHPSLLDGLDDNFRHELDRALSAREVSWSGESAHQRLFVAAAELLRLASAGHGLLLVVDDIHEADQASLRLLHYLARCALEEKAVLALAHRSGGGEVLEEMHASLISRGIGVRVDLAPLGEAATRRLLAQQFESLDDEAAHRIWEVSGGLPFTVQELARAAVAGRPESVGAGLPPAVRRTFERVAMLGSTFTTDELLAVADVGQADAYRHLETALAALVVEPADTGYRFRHALVREGLLSSMPPHLHAAARQEVAERLAGLGAAPGRVAHQFLAAGQPQRAIPYVLPAVETAGALGAYRDALDLVDAVRPYATGDDLGRLLARRGDLLLAMGDPGSVSAYRDALAATSGTQQRLVRARLGRAACFGGDLETAHAALDGLELVGDAADGTILLARGNLAYFSGDVDAAWDAASAARQMLGTSDDPWQYVDLVALQGLIAHQRGEWFERFRLELRRTQGREQLATTVFDAHLCVAEYVLYGPVPYDEVIEQAEGLRRRASHFGALRGVAFASALIGEAALLKGDLDVAERELRESMDLHQESDAPAGEAHSLQRLAEVLLARGDREEAQRLLQRALPLARWSIMSMHLLQRIYGTMIAAAPDPWAARIVVDKAEATLGESDACPFCAIMLAVPAGIACADVGDLEAARRHLAVAEESAARWDSVAWEAAVLEARAHLARAEGRQGDFDALIREACRLFSACGQPLDADRCATACRTLGAAAVPV